MNRLDQLKAMRAAIDVEIDRETRFQQRIRRIDRTVRLVTTRADWAGRVTIAAAAEFEVTVEAITGTTRDKNVVRARQVTAWILRTDGRSYPEIGKALGRDHTTAINACKRVEADDLLMAAAARVREALTGEMEGGEDAA